ncbi:exopolysaccharide biosynthesis polyprenyl glycosylphosphotransferase [Actinomycetospora straminea]|uniref:Exopolysaccharide biosynthesis polyprenyl glycosylphosphotransferase n=1 Tax=Actinomycetospora straminea TaxID=663607 RepID=A0ABP9E297_9PSEU
MAFVLASAITLPTSPTHLLVLLITLITLSMAGLYRSRLKLSLLDDLPYLIAAVVAGLALKVSLSTFVPGIDPPLEQVEHVTVLLLVVIVVRSIAYAIVRGARRRGWVRHRTMVLGAGVIGTRITHALLDDRRYGLEPVGFVDAACGLDKMHLRPLPLLGDYDRLGQLIREHLIRDVIVAFGGTRENALVDMLRTCDRLDVEVFVVPRLFELHNTHRDTDEVQGIPLVRLRRATFRSPWWAVKRLVDAAVAAVALVLLSPILAICALAVRLEGGPGIIFRQQRVGIDNRPFEVLKFRSLKPVDEAESQTNWNIKHDDRLGRLGRLLRASSLDELPQLWNILRGDMSLVGPRPERPHFVEKFSSYIPRYVTRHRVPAGLTGWAQVHGLRGDTSIEERARYDNYYIENWSPWLDLKIILMTVGQVVRRQGG